MRGMWMGPIVAVAAALAGRAARCQGPSAVAAGSHVRITAPSLGWESKTAEVAAVHGDTLMLRRAPGLIGFILSPQPVPLSTVTTIETSMNHDAHQSAMILGALLGAVGGAFAAYNLGGPCPANSFCKLGRALQAMTLGVGVGGGVGILIGGALVPERWAPVGVPRPQVTVSRLPGRRLAFGASLVF